MIQFELIDFLYLDCHSNQTDIGYYKCAETLYIYMICMRVGEPREKGNGYVIMVFRHSYLHWFNFRRYDKFNCKKTFF